MEQPAAVEEHPFRRAWRTRQLDTLVGAFAEDVVLRSPLLSAPFVGREVAAELYGVLFERFGDVEFTAELADGAMRAFFWRAQLGAGTVEGADLIRHDEQGMIREVQVLLRPLSGLGAFAAEMGPPLARRRGPGRALAAAMLTRPLRWLLALADAISPRLVMRRRPAGGSSSRR